MKLRLPALALLALLTPFAASPAEAAYLGCKPHHELPTDGAGCWGCFTDPAQGDATCAAIALTCALGSFTVRVDAESTDVRQWEIWFSSEAATYLVGPFSAKSIHDDWTGYAGDSSNVRAWVKIGNSIVAEANAPCVR